MPYSSYLYPQFYKTPYPFANRQLMNIKYTVQFLKKVEQIYEEAKYIVRYEKGNFASGYCMLEHKKVVVVNKFLNTEGRINALLEILPSIRIGQNLLSEASLKMLGQLNITPQLIEN